MRFPIPQEYLYKSLAQGFMDKMAEAPDFYQHLRTIAVGAMTYSDRKIGAASFPSEDLRDFLRLRIYHVDYLNVYPAGLLTILSLVGKGTADLADGVCKETEIFDMYWLQ